MYKLNLNNRYGTQTIASSDSASDMVNYLFNYCYYPFRNDELGTSLFLTKDNIEISVKDSNKLVENIIPEKIKAYTDGIALDKKPFRACLIKFNLIQSHFIKHLIQIEENRKLEPQNVFTFKPEFMTMKRK